ncbi:MAG: nucleotide exchange factor GrpE [Nanoarchaeota archaeon]|nr:nucleotide exchange factor GrpE [Nanoarchaeota archaeon]
MSQKKSKTNKKKNPKKDRSKEYLDQLQRLQAEFINFRNRVEKEKLEVIKYAKENFILKLLDVLDNFERAIASMETAKDIQNCKKGVSMILTQFKEILNTEGLKAIETKEKNFDPYFHEAIAKVESKEKENKIIEEFQRGYQLKEKVIRPSKVKISGGKKNE